MFDGSCEPEISWIKINRRVPVKRTWFLMISALTAFALMLSSCSPCAKATRLRRKARRADNVAERHNLERQAASFESVCMQKRDAKYENKMQEKFQEMEEKARY